MKPLGLLYRSLEFEERYRRPCYYPDGEAAIVMTCMLPQTSDIA